jgi:hypothetical protein
MAEVVKGCHLWQTFSTTVLSLFSLIFRTFPLRLNSGLRTVGRYWLAEGDHRLQSPLSVPAVPSAVR